jgi:TPR repeat protein
MKRFALILLLLLLASPAGAGFDEGVAAYNRKDYAAALREFLPLARQGHVAAQYNMGVMHESGQGVPQDHAEAVKWYRLAAERGHARAQFNLGGMYMHGWGVPQDRVQAYMWFHLAAERLPEGASRRRAVRARNRTSAQMPPEQIAEAQRLAREWKPKK